MPIFRDIGNQVAEMLPFFMPFYRVRALKNSREYSRRAINGRENP